MTAPGFPAQLTEPGLLEQVLRRSGALVGGRVGSVAVMDSRPQILSRITRIAVTYDGDPGPATLIVKSGLPELDAKGFRGGAHEVDFYTHIAPASPAGVVPHCHDAQWDEASKGWHLLLEDLEASHAVATRWPVPPDLARCTAIVRALARIHAHWWNDPRLGNGIGALPGTDVAGHSPERLAAACEGFLQSLGDSVSAAQRDLIGRVARNFDTRLADRRPREALTIVHGDAHLWNVFLPREGVRGNPLWFDWDSWRVDLAASDLAYMLAMHWYPDHRSRQEAVLLDAYHAALVAQGVSGYSRSQLHDDYRYGVLQHLAAPLHQWSIGVPPVIWWNNLQRLLLAVDDLGCRDLLG